MTVSYQYDVASSTSGGFTRLLFKWKGSLYKLVYRELLLFVLCYTLMSIVYRFILDDTQKRMFEKVAFYCDSFINYIPLSFILGFYVSFVASRWWQQYMAIPWPDKLLHSIALHVTGFDDKGRILRRSMVRYLNLSLVLVLRSISSAVKRRFPTFEHIVEAGFMTSAELDLFKSVPSTEFNTYWVPFTWFTALIKEARAQKRLPDPHGAKLIMEEFNEFRQMCGMLWSFDWVSIPLVYTQEFLDFRGKCGLLWCYDWVSIPLVYTQVVTIATYAFFLACVIGRQYVEHSPIPYRVKPDLYIPYFTLLQFFFYMGLLKVAEQLINPFGDDDEDFELNWIIDRHMKVSYLIVDTLIVKVPPLSKDLYFDQERPVLPYTEAAVPFRKKVYKGSVAKMTVPEDQQTLILPDIEEETEFFNAQERVSKNKITGGILSSHSGMFNQQGQQHTKDQDGTVRLNMNPDPKPFDKSSASPKVSVTSRASSKKSTGSRISVAAGTKGSVSSAVLAVGASQVLLAAGPDSLNSFKTDQDQDDYVFLPMESYYPDCTNDFVQQSEYESPKQSESKKSAFKLPASLKSRVAVRKKPVVKWKPFRKPEELVREDASVGDGEGCYEEECAFMWRTIEEDLESGKPTYYVPSRDYYMTNVESAQEKTIINNYNELLQSYYKDVHPRNLRKKGSSHVDSSSPFIGFSASKCRHRSFRRCSNRRVRARKVPDLYPLLYGSLPSLSYSCLNSIKFIRSLSENSVFIEAVAEKLRSLSETNLPPSLTRSLPVTPAGWHRRKIPSKKL